MVQPFHNRPEQLPFVALGVRSIFNDFGLFENPKEEENMKTEIINSLSALFSFPLNHTLSQLECDTPI